MTTSGTSRLEASSDGVFATAITLLPIIGIEARFYGYITVSGLRTVPSRAVNQFPRLYATSQYNGKTSVWILPDHELFRQLAKQLVDTAVLRTEHGDYAYAQLWISTKDERWDVDPL